MGKRVGCINKLKINNAQQFLHKKARESFPVTVQHHNLNGISVLWSCISQSVPDKTVMYSACGRFSRVCMETDSSKQKEYPILQPLSLVNLCSLLLNGDGMDI